MKLKRLRLSLLFYIKFILLKGVLGDQKKDAYFIQCIKLDISKSNEMNQNQLKNIKLSKYQV